MKRLRTEDCGLETEAVAVSFLLHFPSPRVRTAPEGRYGRGRWPLAITVPCGARTFLPRLAPAATVRPARGNRIIPHAGRYHNDGQRSPCTSSDPACLCSRSGSPTPRPTGSVVGW